MLKMSAKHASIFATLRLADLGLSTRGLAETRWRAMRAFKLQREYRFL